MRTMRSLCAYQWHVYMKTSRGVMPFVALVIFLAGHYAVSPFHVADSYAFSMTVLVLVMGWAGFTAAEVEDPISEQLLILKCGSAARYQAAVSAFLASLGAALALVTCVFPVIIQWVYGPGTFHTPLTLGAFGYALVLHCAAAFLGGAIGALLHPRIVPDRKMAVLFLLFLLVTGFVTPGLHRDLPWTVWVTWLFPPTSRASTLLAGQDVFPFGVSVRLFVTYILYGLVFTGLRIALLVKRKFA